MKKLVIALLCAGLLMGVVGSALALQEVTPSIQAGEIKGIGWISFPVGQDEVIVVDDRFDVDMAQQHYPLIFISPVEFGVSVIWKPIYEEGTTNWVSGRFILKKVGRLTGTMGSKRVFYTIIRYPQ